MDHGFTDLTDLRGSDPSRFVQSASSVVCPLRPRDWRRQFSGFDLGLEAHARVTAITKWFVLRMTAAAKRDHCSSSEPKCIPCHVLNNDVVADYAIRAIVVADDLRVVAHPGHLP